MIWKLQDQKLVIKLGVEIEGSGGWRVERIKDRYGTPSEYGTYKTVIWLI